VSALAAATCAGEVVRSKDDVSAQEFAEGLETVTDFVETDVGEVKALFALVLWFPDGGGHRADVERFDGDVLVVGEDGGAEFIAQVGTAVGDAGAQSPEAVFEFEEILARAVRCAFRLFLLDALTVVHTFL